MRLILIDDCSGYIFGDSADTFVRGKLCELTFEGGQSLDDNAIIFARFLDASVGEHGREYDVVYKSQLASNETGYHVYRVDVRGSEAVPVFQDGQDQEAIDAVERDCEYISTIRVTTTA